jgi:hypothetical protein
MYFKTSAPANRSTTPISISSRARPAKLFRDEKLPRRLEEGQRRNLRLRMRIATLFSFSGFQFPFS